MDVTFIAASEAEARGVLSRLERLHLKINYEGIYGEKHTYDSKAPA